MKYLGRLVVAILQGQTEWGRTVRFWSAFIMGFMLLGMMCVVVAAFNEWQSRPSVINISARIDGPVYDLAGRQLEVVDEKDLLNP